MSTLADLVQDSDVLSTLEVALKAAESLDTLATEGPYTVLAPIDEAFGEFAAAFPDLFGVLTTRPWRLHLLDLLFSHILEGAVLSTDLVDGDGVRAVSGERLTVAQQGDALCFTPSFDSQACVVLADVPATNGVAHLIDSLISPVWIGFSIYTAAVTVLPTLATLVECADLADFFAYELGITVSDEQARGKGGVEDILSSSQPCVALSIDLCPCGGRHSDFGYRLLVFRRRCRCVDTGLEVSRSVGGTSVNLYPSRRVKGPDGARELCDPELYAA
jgi:uncharacterized surface protein with fasciclin (FAS1) repeats